MELFATILEVSVPSSLICQAIPNGIGFCALRQLGYPQPLARGSFGFASPPYGEFAIFSKQFFHLKYALYLYRMQTVL